MPVGDIVHIEGLYVKPQAVKSNISMLKGEYLIFDTDGLRPLLASDFTANDTFLDLNVHPVVQAGHNADNLNTTPVNQRVSEVSVITPGSDMVCKMAAGVKPAKKVGIHRLDSRTPVIAISDVEDTLVTPSAPLHEQTFGQYKHKEFSTKANDSVLNDDGVIATGGL